MKIREKSLFYILLSFTLCGCSTPAATPTPDLNWQVQVTSHEVKDSLTTVEVVTQYNGSKLNMTHQQSPAQGNVYLIINLTVRKAGNQPVTFNWQDLTVQDQAGSSFHRVSNDTFLEQHHYTPRMTGLEMRLGENQGWVCFEIPASVAGGPLTLVYSGEGSQQQISLQK